MNFLEDRGVGMIYLPTKFQLHRFISNGDLLSERNHRDKHTHRHTDRQTDRQTHKHTYTQTETDSLPIYRIG